MRIGNLEVDVPSSWDDLSLYTFVEGEGAGFRTNVVFQSRKVSPPYALEEGMARVLASTRESFKDVSIEIDEPKDVLPWPTKRLRYSVNDSVSKQRVCQIVYLCVVEGREWNIAFSSVEADLPKSLPHIERIIRSLNVA